MRRTAFALLLLALVAAGCVPGAQAAPRCRDEGSAALVLMAQAVPDAAYLPCVGELPSSWGLQDVEIARGRAALHIVVDRNMEASSRVDVTLSGSCPPAPAGAERDSGIDGVRRVDTVEDLPNGRTVATRTYRFDGGCVAERYNVPPQARGAVLGRAWALLGLVAADDVSAEVEEVYGRPLR